MVRVALCVELLYVPEMCAVVAALTLLVLTVKVVLVVPASTVTVPLAGTCAEVESLETLTAAPPVGAAPVSVTVAVEVCRGAVPMDSRQQTARWAAG